MMLAEPRDLARAESLSAFRVPPRAAIPLRVKAAVLVEVLLTYAAGLRQLRREELKTMAAWSRAARIRLQEVAPADERDLALRLGWLVGRILGVLPTDSRCLIRSLVLVRVLQRRGIDTRLAIGVKTGPPFEAHAWVEHDGRPVLPQQGFLPLLEV